jgi:ATP-dependent helicase YprA (DUF1998 family)
MPIVRVASAVSRYWTAGESDVKRQEIAANPPDILRTNFMMAERSCYSPARTNEIPA